MCFYLLSLDSCLGLWYLRKQFGSKKVSVSMVFCPCSLVEEIDIKAAR